MRKSRHAGRNTLEQKHTAEYRENRKTEKVQKEQEEC